MAHRRKVVAVEEAPPKKWEGPLLLLLIVLGVCAYGACVIFGEGGIGAGRTPVKGYQKKDGTQVAPHTRKK